MKTFRFTLRLLLFSFSAFSQTVSVEEFKKITDSSGLKFEMPKEYKVTKIIKNRDLDYSFAMINADSTMEVRYSIFTLKSRLKEYNDYQSSTNKTSDGMTNVMSDPNKLYWALTLSTMSNLTNGNPRQGIDYNKDAVKEEFNADFGTTVMFKLDCEYGKGYAAANLITLHKDNVADVLIVILTNIKNSDKYYSEMLIPFHSLTYK